MIRPLLALSLLCLPMSAHAECSANVINAIDVSGSMAGEPVKIELQGVAMALQSPDVLVAIQAGECIHVVTYLWADGTRFVSTEWRTIRTAEDASVVAGEILSLAADQNVGTLTNIAAALEQARIIASQAPSGERTLINIISDGVANFGGSPAGPRQAILDTGAIINAVVVGGTEATKLFFRSSVIGGKGSFVITADKPEGLVWAVRRKFISEIAQVMP